MEYGLTFPLKEWMTIERAARHLSIVLREEVTEADVLRFGIQKHLKLSVYFPNLTKARSGELVRYPEPELEASIAAGSLAAELKWALFSAEAATSLPDLPKEAEGKPVLAMRTLRIDAERCVVFNGKVTTVGGVWDLPMIGGEQLDIEHKFQQLINGQPVIWAALEGVIVQGSDGDLCQLQEQFSIKEYSSIWDMEHRDLKQYIIDADIEKEEGERLLNEHKEERKQTLKTIKALPASESYYPARRLPKDSTLVVRKDALREFERLVISAQPGEGNPTTEIEPNASPASSCQPCTAAIITRNFIVKSDPDENAEWWKDKMREAKRNGLAECRVGEGSRGPGGSLWRADLIAGWLVDRHEKGREGLNKKATGAALRRFPGCEEAAYDFFSTSESIPLNLPRIAVVNCRGCNTAIRSITRTS